MSSVEAVDAKEIVQEENEVLTSYEENEVREQNGADIPEKPEQLEKSEENSMPSSQEEEAVLKKKYGGMLPKKPPLISKDHERAFFDSADWALGKVTSPKDHSRHLGQNCSPHNTINFAPGDLLMLLQIVKMEAKLLLRNQMLLLRNQTATIRRWLGFLIK